MKILSFWKPALWLAIICYGLFIPASELPTKPFLSIPHFDKIVHFSLFFGLNVLLMRPLKKLNLKYYLLAPAISVFFGLILEYEQHIITISRNTDIYDFFAIISVFFFYRAFY
jgi:hypothetical protein